MHSLSVKKVKNILQIEESDYDNYIEEMIPLSIAMAEEYCNNEFGLRDELGVLIKSEDNEYFINKAGLVVPIAKMIQYHMHKSGVTQESISRVMYSYAGGLPKSITQMLNPHRKVEWI